MADVAELAPRDPAEVKACMVKNVTHKYEHHVYRIFFKLVLPIVRLLWLCPALPTWVGNIHLGFPAKLLPQNWYHVR